MNTHTLYPNVDSMVTDYASPWVTVKVEDGLWDVARHAFLRHSRSPWIQDMFRRPQLRLLDKQKLWIGNAALPLPGVTGDDFGHLLSVLSYEQQFASPQFHELLKVEQWEGVQRLASESLLMMPEIFDRATLSIETLKAQQLEREFRQWQAEQYSHHEWLAERNKLYEEWQADQCKLREEDEERRRHQWLDDWPTLSETTKEEVSV